ncbi:uncharacterized protein LOC136092602 [Hydra vulgaris]|uniref:uncharacterized protein LOC136092602 n=1 Tax=Hydra vulgaris TaxID=6087 RepID=UPI0032EA369E
MGVSALDSHATGKKHKEHARTHNAADIFFTDFTTEISGDKAASSNFQELSPHSNKVLNDKVTQPTIDDLQSPALVTKAEILWTLNVVMSHFSLRSCLNLNEIFKFMFSDSKIASKFALGKTKCGYLINFGLVPYYRDQLISEVIANLESMNVTFKNEQMDCGVRYWDSNSGVVKVRYIDSKFLRPPNAQNLFDKLIEATEMFDLGKLIQVSMDGPNVNWEVLKMLNEHRQEKRYSDIVNMGSCSCSWCPTDSKLPKVGVGKIFRAMYNLFKESPAKIDEFIRVCETDLLALP